jgi:hypothetical protein
MSVSTSGRRGLGTAAVLLAAAVSLTACGTQRATDTSRAARTPTSSVTSASPGTSTSPSPRASPFVEPGAGDGAPHYRENNAHRLPGEMSAAGARDAEREVERIEPVLKRLWQQRKWDPASVRAALLRLGYEEERTGPKGERLGGTLTVQPMPSRYETDHYVTPEGARVALRVHDDACVTAYVQKSTYGVATNGPYLETGCFAPPAGH